MGHGQRRNRVAGAYNHVMTSEPIAKPEKLPFFPKQKKFLIPIGILFAAMVIGLPAGVLIGSSAVKSSEAFELTLAKLESSESVKAAIGLPLEVGAFARGSHDDSNGTYELTFKISGSIERDVVVRSWCVSEAQGEPWEIAHLAVGIGGRAGQEITLVGDPKNPPWSRQ